MAIYNKSFRKMAEMSVGLLAKSIIKVVTPDGEEVTSPNEIYDFVQNIDSAAAKKLDGVLSKINNLDIDKRLDMVCSNEECKNNWTTEVDFNPTDFFAVGS